MFKYSLLLLLLMIGNCGLNLLHNLQGAHRHYKLRCSGENEIYLPEGVGPLSGDVQCDKLEGHRNKFCLAPAGCFCRGGYARDCYGKCIPTEMCNKPLCNGPNEESLDTSDEPTCDPRCRRLDRQRQCSKQSQCNRSDACYCITGTARNDNLTCVPIVNCPLTKRRCFGTNEIFLDANEAPRCDAFCDDTTINDENEQEDENAGLLITAGCYCREGFFRNEDMQCVERRYCKVQCPGKHEIFLPRGTAPRCEIQCDPTCPAKCLPVLDIPEGCYCKKGYCKNDCGMCIPEKNNEQRVNSVCQ